MPERLANNLSSFTFFMIMTEVLAFNYHLHTSSLYSVVCLTTKVLIPPGNIYTKTSMVLTLILKEQHLHAVQGEGLAEAVRH